MLHGHARVYPGGRHKVAGLSMASSSSDLSGEYDVAVIGAGIGGLCAAAVLTQCYGRRVAVLESHYLAGGCAHAFDRRAADGTEYTFDSGPTIVLGCSVPPYNPLRQVLNAVGAGDAVEWLAYDGWGMVVPPDEAPTQPRPGHWKLQLGPGHFQKGPLADFGGPQALKEFEELREACNPLVAAAADIPAMSMRGDSWSLLPLLRHFEARLSVRAILRIEIVVCTTNNQRAARSFRRRDPFAGEIPLQAPPTPVPVPAGPNLKGPSRRRSRHSPARASSQRVLLRPSSMALFTR